MGDRLAGKSAIITGGASGIGLAAVRRFVQEGANVTFCDLTPDRTRALRGEIGAEGWGLHHNRRTDGDEYDGHRIADELGAQAAFVPADVSRRADMAAVVDTALDRYGRLDILYCNAGIGGGRQGLLETSEEVWSRLMAVNLHAVWEAIKLSAPHLIAAGRGAVVATASLSGSLAFPGNGAYGVAKAGLAQLIRSTALELAQHNVRANAVLPGPILTPLAYDSPRQSAPRDPATLADVYRSRTPLPVVGRAEHVANVALWLACDEAEFVTGQSINVDGGLSIEGNALLRGMLTKEPAQ